MFAINVISQFLLHEFDKFMKIWLLMCLVQSHSIWVWWDRHGHNGLVSERKLMRFNNAFVVLKEAKNFVIVPLVSREGVRKRWIGVSIPKESGTTDTTAITSCDDRIVFCNIGRKKLFDRNRWFSSFRIIVWYRCCSVLFNRIFNIPRNNEARQRAIDFRKLNPTRGGSRSIKYIKICFSALRMVCSLARPCHKKLNPELRWQVLK